MCCDQRSRTGQRRLSHLCVSGRVFLVSGVCLCTLHSVFLKGGRAWVCVKQDIAGVSLSKVHGITRLARSFDCAPICSLKP
jgi:hypothetical protein